MTKKVFEGNKDLINLMQCQNCLSMIIKKGKPYCKDKKEEVHPEDTCSSWTENLGKGKELHDAFIAIINILKDFIDTKEENYELIALWIIGTWKHQEFPTYPYLFINAMKGSGKTRLLKLIKELSWDGEMLASLSEAVLFRTTGTLCIDEFEGIRSKEKNALRELLNTAYKKGGKVIRMRKKKSKEGEEMVADEFPTFRPIVMANISGMEEVLEDRCITLILEKSNNSTITRMVENFSEDKNVLKVRNTLKFGVGSVGLTQCRVLSKLYERWNMYIKLRPLHTLNYTPTHTTLSNTTLHLFDKIYATNIDGRNLELTFPLLLLADEMGIFDKFVKKVIQLVEEKKSEDIMEGRDIMLYGFIEKQTEREWYKIKQLTNLFRQVIDYDTAEEGWLNNTWMGKALKRLNLIGKKRRMGEGVEVILDINKAKEKMQIFK